MALLADDHLAAARAADRVGRPAAARRHPDHVGVVVGGRGHQHVVAVGDDDHAWVCGQPGPQPALDHVDLADPVQLVAGQVEQNDGGGLDGIRHMRHVHFVDLEDRERGVAVSGQRGHQTGVHIRALGVGGHAAQGAQGGRGHPGRRRLAVGPGDDDRAPTGPELTQNGPIQRHRHQAADHRPRPATGHPGGPSRAGPGGEGQASSGVDHPGILGWRHEAQRPDDVGSA